MKLVFKSEDALQDVLKDFGKDKLEDLTLRTFMGEELKVNAQTLEVERANGYERVVGQWLQDGLVKIGRAE